MMTVLVDVVGNVKAQGERCPVRELDQVQYPRSRRLVLRDREKAQRLLRGGFFQRPCLALGVHCPGVSQLLSGLSVPTAPPRKVVAV